MCVELSLVLYAHALFYHTSFFFHYAYDTYLARINSKWNYLNQVAYGVICQIIEIFFFRSYLGARSFRIL